MAEMFVESARIGGPIKPRQSWEVLKALDLRAGLVREAKLPAEMASKYKKITAPAARLHVLKTLSFKSDSQDLLLKIVP